MSRCASGSSSSSTSGRRARQAASATSLRWPPESSRVGQRERVVVEAERAQVAARLALGAVAARARSSGASSRSWLASARVIASRSRGERAGRRGAARPRASSRLERGELGPRGEHGGERVALVAVDDLRQGREHEPAAAGDGAGVGVSSRPARMRSSVDLPPPLGPSTPIRGAAGDVEVEPVEDRAAAEGLREAAGGEQRDRRCELVLARSASGRPRPPPRRRRGPPSRGP